MKENIEEVVERLEKSINDVWFSTTYSQEDEERDLQALISDYKRLQEEFKQVDHECERLEQKEVRLEKENEELKEELFMLKTKTKRQKIKDLECHCGECDDEIYRICNKYCNYQDDEVALCERERFANMDIEDYEKIEKTLRIEKKMEDIIEKLQKENEELKSSNEKLERANKCYINSIHSIVPVLNQDYISKQKIKDKIEELKNKSGGNVFHIQQTINAEIRLLQDLLEEKGE